jgi:hypothetical protein
LLQLLLWDSGARILAVAFRSGDDFTSRSALIHNLGPRIANGGTNARSRIGATRSRQGGRLGSAALSRATKHGFHCSAAGID